MERLLLYVHFNKFNFISGHVLYQLKNIRPLYSRVVFISNSQLPADVKTSLSTQQLVDYILERENIGFDFAAWRDGMKAVGFDQLAQFDSVTLMNDTCFGPLWDLEPIYKKFENDEEVDFWGMTNYRKDKDFNEHIQSYYLSFKKKVLESKVFQEFWQGVQDFTNVQDVIDNYETKVTTNFLEAGFCYKTVFHTIHEDTTGMLYPDFSYYNPTAILRHKVPFIKVKTISHNQGIMPYIFNEIEKTSQYPLDLIINHMSMIDRPDFPYLLSRKYLKDSKLSEDFSKKVAVHLHVFYVDLLEEFLDAFRSFHFDFDLWITTDLDKKKSEIQKVLIKCGYTANVVVTGNVGRDVFPMLRLKDELSQYDYVGHFHTKKSKEADFWAGESWRHELIDMLVKPANLILANMENNSKIGITIADIPTFFRYNRIVVAWNEALISPEMNKLWERMGATKEIDFEKLNTFIMSYGTFVWFKYDALSPLFNLDLKEDEIPSEPLPQNSDLHAIERLLIYIAWDQKYDFRISQNTILLTPFIDNKQLNNREDLQPHTYVDFDYLGGIKGAMKYIFIGPARAVKYILKKSVNKYLKRNE